MKNIMVLLTFTIVGFMLTVNTIAKTVVTDDLVGYWTFDQGTVKGKIVKDVWGENDATIVGDPREIDGYVRGGLELDGNGDYVSLPNVGNFGRKLGEYTFEAWFKTTNQEEWSAIYRVLENACARWNHGTGILINATITRDRGLNKFETEPDAIAIERSSVVGNGCGSSRSVSFAAVSDGEWHQIVYTSRPATKEELEQFDQIIPPNQRPRPPAGACLRNTVFIDTEIISNPLSCSSPPDVVAFEEPIFLGAVNNMGKASGFFNGAFDEVRIYDRALSQEEVIRNYRSGIGLGVEAVEKLPMVWGALKAQR